MDSAGRTNTAGEKLRVDPDIRASIYGDSAGSQNFSEQLSLRVIGISLVSSIDGPVDWKCVLVKLIPKTAKN